MYISLQIFKFFSSQNFLPYLELVQPGWLVVVLGGEDARVEEHEADDQPEHPLRLAHLPRLPPHAPVPPVVCTAIFT